MNYTGPKVKLSRKLGIPLTLKARKYMQKRPYPPGQHGRNRRFSKLSDYGKQLLEKQRLRYQYNISDRQLRRYFEKASRMEGNTADNLIQLLERRLDAFVFHAGLARSIWAARQYVTHGHILVNGKKINIPSYQLNVNDEVQVKEKSRKLPCFQEAIRVASPPPYIELSKAELKAKFLYIPPREEVPVICEVPQVIEFYAR